PNLNQTDDLYRNPHRLSLHGKIILFNRKRASATNDGERSELIFCSLSFERGDNAFLKAADGAAVISRRRSDHVDIVKCKCATDAQERHTTACVLVTKKSEKGQSFQYSLLTLSSSNRLEPCIEFKLSYQMKENVYILQGPTVLWTHEDSVFYTSLQAGGVKRIPIQFSHMVAAEFPLHKGQIFVLGLQNLSEKSLIKQSTSQTVGYFVQDGLVFDGSLILPHPYIRITRCIFVLKADRVDGALKCTLVAATSKQQLVYFENGTVKEICQLPFEQPDNIQVVDTGRNGCLLVISFHQGHVCAVWKETFQVSSFWSGVSSVHSDDFLGCGTEQMLLIFKDQGAEGQQLEKFLITDLCGLSYSTSSPPAENYLLTLQWEGLTALWDCDDESKDEVLDDKMQHMPTVSSKPHIDKLWHRITEDRMIVGVMLSMSTLSLSILTEASQSSTPAVIQTRSQVFWLPAPCPSSSSSASTFSEPAAKRSKQHNASRPNDLNTCRLAVTAVTKLTPLLNSGCVKCRVMLHYIQRQDAFALLSNPTPAVLHCGQVALDINDDLQSQLLKNPQLKTDEVREDLLSLLAVLDRWVFHIDSPDYSLGDIDGWIQKRVGCKKIEVSPEYLLLNSSGPSALMLLRWHQITPFQGELSVHSSQLQMLQFLDSLLAYLPASCSVQSVKGVRGEGTAQMLGLALEKEVVSLRDHVSLLLCEEEEEEAKKKSTGHELNSVEGLQRCREVWQQDVERTRMRLSPLVDVGKYRKLIQSVSKVQLEGDFAALLNTQRT
uniref:FA complementation group B n=1 Tax=Amphiprion percula TaxID=161767 RepID=A0A3P8UES6_AMPPE